MRTPGRLAAAIAVLDDMEKRKRPVAEALKDWGLSNRFAGAGDRAAIGNLVYDVLRKRSSHSFAMGSETPRALVLSVAVREWGESPDALNADFAGDRFAPESISEEEAAKLLAAEPLRGAPDHVRADLPQWCVASIAESLGADWIAEGEAMAARPPLDLRVNTLKSSRERVLKSLSRFHPEETAVAANGVRMPAGLRDARTPNVITDEGYLKGWFEVQDQGSQIVSALTGAKPNEQVLDLCAGGGGKTLAMAAAMDNKGQIFAYDSDRSRLAPIYDRLKRNGVRNAQVRAPESGALEDLVGKLDRVVIDAPCTGTGTWRRRPDAKWKLSPDQLAFRATEQQKILDDAIRFVRPGGALVYITCSLLAEENGQQVARFLGDHPDFSVLPADRLWHGQFGGTGGRARFSPHGLTLTPHLTGTDGFFVSVLARSA